MQMGMLLCVIRIEGAGVLPLDLPSGDQPYRTDTAIEGKQECLHYDIFDGELSEISMLEDTLTSFLSKNAAELRELRQRPLAKIEIDVGAGLVEEKASLNLSFTATILHMVATAGASLNFATYKQSSC